MTTPLTHEEVAKLRLPEGYSLSHMEGQWGWRSSLSIDEGNDRDMALAFIACDVANGIFPRWMLDAAWVAVSGMAVFYSNDGMNHVEEHTHEAEARAEAEDAFECAADNESLEEIENVEWGVMIQLGGSRVVGERDDGNGEKMPVYELKGNGE